MLIQKYYDAMIVIPSSKCLIPSASRHIRRYLTTNNKHLPALKRILSAGAQTPTGHSTNSLSDPKDTKLFTPTGNEYLPVACIDGDTILQEAGFIRRKRDCVGTPVNNAAVAIIQLLMIPFTIGLTPKSRYPHHW